MTPTTEFSTQSEMEYEGQSEEMGVFEAQEMQDYLQGRTDATAKGELLGDDVGRALAWAQANAPRTLQSADRVLGMSELGGCREFIRATVAGDDKTPDQRIKWAAYVGTALGDYAESDLKRDNPKIITQRRLTVKLSNGMMVSGSADAIYPPGMDLEFDNAILDFKSKNGLATIRKEGPTFKEMAQISGYVVAGVQDGTLHPGATGHLIYIDRSGADSGRLVWSVSEAEARTILSTAVDRLASVAHALTTAQHAERDEPESWCYAIQCPFYASCWAGYTPTDEITSPRVIEAVGLYIEGRADTKMNKDLMTAAREEIRGDPRRDHELANGVLPDGTVVRFTLVQSAYGGYEKLDVREPR